VPIASEANSVASALGNRTRRDPGAAVRTYHEGPEPALKTGTFYLAGNRNFLFGSDMGGPVETPKSGRSRFHHRFNHQQDDMGFESGANRFTITMYSGTRVHIMLTSRGKGLIVGEQEDRS
jgi:hypothetical protein